MIDFLTSFHLQSWVSSLGYIGIILVVLLEMGFFFGFFLPGDSLVFTAGMLAAKGVFDISTLITVLIVTAIIGYSFGYWFGNKLGHWLLKQKDSIWFKKKYMDYAHEFYHRHGGKALILGRLVPIARTFVPIVAGMAEMPYKSYFIYNVTGALLWGGGVTLAGYYIGTLFPQIVNYLLPMVILIVLASILPGIWHYAKAKFSAKDKK